MTLEVKSKLMIFHSVTNDATLLEILRLLAQRKYCNSFLISACAILYSAWICPEVFVRSACPNLQSISVTSTKHLLTAWTSMTDPEKRYFLPEFFQLLVCQDFCKKDQQDLPSWITSLTNVVHLKVFVQNCLDLNSCLFSEFLSTIPYSFYASHHLFSVHNCTFYSCFW